jgi:hypothetical protein
MKTTNYEISKKLREIGFDRESVHGFIETKYGVFPEFGDYKSYVPHCFCKSYDLETILEALPNVIISNYGKYKAPWHLQIINKKHFRYENYGNEILTSVHREDENQESLADTAARLLLKLHAEGLVNFKSEEICK